MPIEIQIGEQPPAGYALGAAREGEMARIQSFEFTSSEDGQHFINRVEGFPNTIISRLPRESAVSPSQIDNLLALIERNGKAIVYVNELELSALCRSAHPIKSGSPVTKDDIVDIEALDFGVEIPPDIGFAFLFSIGWRKGFVYDFQPLGPDNQPRQFNVKSVLGQAFCHVMFQDRFSISDTAWNALFAAKWFPFASMRDETLKQLVAFAEAGWNPDELLDTVADELAQRVPTILEAWRKRESFASHIEILETAVDRFQAQDFVSCTGLLFQRIEGILRTHHSGVGAANTPNQRNLANTAVAKRLENRACLLLPRQFEKFLSEVYFASFNPAATDIGISRNSVSHGVASASEFNKKSAVLGLLIVHHLFFCMS